MEGRYGMLLTSPARTPGPGLPITGDGHYGRQKFPFLQEKNRYRILHKEFRELSGIVAYLGILKLVYYVHFHVTFFTQGIQVINEYLIFLYKISLQIQAYPLLLKVGGLHVFLIHCWQPCFDLAIMGFKL
jgi:hypothetical protein